MNNEKVLKTIMNNEDFAKLVRGKSTKEIAREAVESEFYKGKKKKRRRRDNDDDSSSDEDDNNKRNQRLKRNKDDKNESKHPSKDDDPLQQVLSKYRDRAKERREGKDDDDNLKYNMKPYTKSAADQVFEAAVAAVESGDREALAKLKVTTNKDMEDHAQKQKFLENIEQAQEWISDPSSKQQPRSNLGKEIFDYMKQEYLPSNDESIKMQTSMQRSYLLFRVHPADPKCSTLSWEYPAIHTYVTTDTVYENSSLIKATPCDESFINELERIEQRNKRYLEQKRQQEQQQIQGNNYKKKKESIVEESSDDEEDIFGGVGDYDATEAIVDNDNEKDNQKDINNEGDKDKEKDKQSTKISIFGNSVKDTEKEKHSDNDNYYYNNTQPTIVLPRFSEPTSYDDDGVGMDFGANYDDDDDNDKKKKKKNRKKKNDDDDDE